MKDNTKTMYHERMLMILQHIQANLDNDLSLDELAGLSYFSPTHFHRVFKEMIGETLGEHVRRIRIERAAHRLAHNTCSVTEAAFEAGFESIEAFSRAFRRMFGCPPSKYGERHWDHLYAMVPGNVHYMPRSRRNSLKLIHNDNEIPLRIERVPDRQVAFMRHVGPYSQSLEAWNEIMKLVGPKYISLEYAEFLGIWQDDPVVTPSEKQRYDACLLLETVLDPHGNMGIQMIPGGKFAVTTNVGPMESLEKACAELCGTGIPQQDLRHRQANGFFVYRTNPADTEPNEMITDIYLPII